MAVEEHQVCRYRMAARWVAILLSPGLNPAFIYFQF